VRHGEKEVRLQVSTSANKERENAKAKVQNLKPAPCSDKVTINVPLIWKVREIIFF
jgi:hypothetical protein